MEEYRRKFKWALAFTISLLVILVILLLHIIIEAMRNKPPEYSADTIRKIQVCRTYSNDFWRNDIDFIDGKCYYKGKEVEIK